MRKLDYFLFYDFHAYFEALYYLLKLFFSDTGPKHAYFTNIMLTSGNFNMLTHGNSKHFNHWIKRIGTEKSVESYVLLAIIKTHEDIFLI